MNKTRSNLSLVMLLGVIVLAAAGLRLLHLGERSLWFDEALTVEIASGPVEEIPAQVREQEQIPPLYHALSHYWIAAFGDSEVWVRTPAALFGVAAVMAIYFLGAALFGPVEGLFASALLALSGFQIYYAQEARPYTLFVLLAVVSTLSFLKWMTAGGRTWAIVYALSSGLLLWTHLFAVFVIVAQQLTFWTCWFGMGAQRRGKALSWIVLSVICTALFVPWAPTVLYWMSRVSTSFWIPPIHLTQLFQAYLAYAGNLPLFILLVLLAAWGVIHTPDGWKNTLLLSLAILPVAVPVLISMMGRPVFVARYGIVAVVGLYLLAACGFAHLPKQPIKIVTALLIAVFIPFDLYHTPARLNTKPDVRSAVRHLVDHDAAGDTIILDGGFNNLTFRYYLLRCSDQVNATQILDQHGDLDPASIAGVRRLWKITQPAGQGQYSTIPTATLNALGWRIIESKQFDNVTIELFAHQSSK